MKFLFFSSTKLLDEKIVEYRKGIKIYDVFTFFNELELLEIRLNILEPYVDYFVIIESTETFSGQPKPLVYEKNKARFKKFKDKIIHYVITDTPKDEDNLRKRLQNPALGTLDKEIVHSALTSDNVPKGIVHWLKEFYQKETIKKALLGLNDSDMCFVSDVDEIWNPNVLIDYRKDDIFKLRQDVYVYYLNNRSNEWWAGTLVTKYANVKNACLNHLRTASKTKYTYIKNGGWHFTNQGGAEQIKQKLEATYSKEDYNNQDVISNLRKRMQNNKDYIGRKYKFWFEEKNLPEYILKNRDRYAHLFKPSPKV